MRVLSLSGQLLPLYYPKKDQRSQALVTPTSNLFYCPNSNHSSRSVYVASPQEADIEDQASLAYIRRTCLKKTKIVFKMIKESGDHLIQSLTLKAKKPKLLSTPAVIMLAHDKISLFCLFVLFCFTK